MFIIIFKLNSSSFKCKRYFYKQIIYPFKNASKDKKTIEQALSKVVKSIHKFFFFFLMTGKKIRNQYYDHKLFL